jgi:hypothetical protein
VFLLATYLLDVEPLVISISFAYNSEYPSVKAFKQD